VIGDTIVWYARNGVIHFIPNIDESRLEKIKQGRIKNDLTDNYEITQVNLPTENARIAFGGTVDARWQYEFCWKNDCGSRRKYVHELYNYRSGDQYTLYLRIKLEWYGNKSHDWKPAGEYRYTNWNFSYTAGLYGGRDTRNYGYFYGSQSGSDWRNQDRPVFIASDYLAYSSSTYWDIDVQGSIYQEIQDDPNHGWSSIGYPLW
jgi:hypothetical protein